MIDIVQSTVVVASSGIEDLNNQVQVSGAVTSLSVVEFGSFSKFDNIITPAGIGGDTSTRAFQGAGQSTTFIGTKAPGQLGFVFNNVIQNPSFEGGLRRWSVVLGNSGDNAVVVSEQPAEVGFNDSDPVDVPNGSRMTHLTKNGEAGIVALVQGINVSPTDTSNLGEFRFSVSGDSPFRPGSQSVAGKFFDIVLEFFNLESLQFRLNYNFSSGQRPTDFPAELLPISRTVSLSYTTPGIFLPVTRDLSSDVNQSFDFDSVRIWFIQGQTEVVFEEVFDTLLDDVSLTIGTQQSALESTSDEAVFLLFDADFSRAINLLGVIGTSGTVEKFYDRGEFFFGSHETDPNTLRDLSEAQQFLIFTQTNIRSIDNFKNTIGGAALISSKGDEVSSISLQPTDIVSNGGFETGSLSNWQIVQSETTDSAAVVGSIPAIDGFLTILPPNSGNHLLFTRAIGNPPRDSLVLKQDRKLFTEFDASILNQFSFASARGSFGTSMVAVRFLNNSNTSFVIHYVLSTVPVQIPDEILDFDKRINLNTSQGQWSLSLRNIFEDMSRPAFSFDEVEIWIVTNTPSDSSDVSTGWDDFSLTLNVTNLDLLKTSSFANLFTGHPTASGFPFTISGSDNINQPDESPPFFDETFPVSGTSFNPPDSVITFHVKDAGTALDVGSIDVWVQVNNNELNKVVTAGSPEVSATYPVITRTDITSRDIRYDITRSGQFPQQAIVLVSGTFADFASPSNGQTQFYDFKLLGSGSLNAEIIGLPDATSPTIIPNGPVNFDTQVSPNTSVSWATTDNASGVDPSTLVLTLNGKIVIANDLAKGGTFSRIPNAQLGFDYEFIPSLPFDFGQTVTGTVTVSDFATNTGTLTYTWDTTPDDTLDIVNFFLNSGQSTLLTSGTLASVEVIDFTHGVNASGTFLTVNDVVPSGLITVLSGSLPDRLIFEFEVEPLVNFRQDLNIFVHAENLFPGDFPVIREEHYVLRPGYKVDWPNRNLDSALPGPETEFPFITNIQVLTEAKNFAKSFNTGAEFYRFLTKNLSRKDLGASIESNVKVADLSAFLNVKNPFFEYGKTMTLEVEVSDLEGNIFSFTHVFTIEEDPT